MEQFAVNFALLLGSGTPILEAVRTVQEVFKESPLYYDAIRDVYMGVSRGSGIAASLDQTGLFTPMVINMTKMGEESGKLGEVLEQVAIFYREKLDTTITRITSLLEPAIVIVMGLVFAVIMASIYIPMFQLAGAPG